MLKGGKFLLLFNYQNTNVKKNHFRGIRKRIVLGKFEISLEIKI